MTSHDDRPHDDRPHDDRPHDDPARVGLALAVASLPHMGPGRIGWFLAQPDPERVWERIRSGASLPLRGWTQELGATWQHAALTLDPRAIAARHDEAGITVGLHGSGTTPPRLLDDPRPPPVLCWAGRAVPAARPAVAVVGTRRCTAYGRQVAADLGAQLAALGVVVVSGLAAGIDAEAQRSALRRGGTVVGVVAGGLDQPYPRRNTNLWRAVAEQGWLVAEAPLGVRPDAWRFPLRNRIIAALADVVVVVESSARGGSLHTVREAEVRDRIVLAVPGPVTSEASVGTNDLLADGCAPCRGIDDLITALDLVHASSGWRSDRGSPPPGAAADAAGGSPRVPPLGGDAAAVLDALGWEPLPIDEVMARCGLGLAAVSAAVAELGALGLVDNDGGVLERSVRT